MPGCVLRVGGEEFDPDRFLATSGFTAYATWRKGEPLAATGPRASRVHSDSGFLCDVSPTDQLLREQIADAEIFLNRHRVDFERIAADPTVFQCQLDFGYYCRIGDPMGASKVCVQGEYLPVPFLQLVSGLRIGVALTLYPPRDGA